MTQSFADLLLPLGRMFTVAPRWVDSRRGTLGVAALLSLLLAGCQSLPSLPSLSASPPAIQSPPRTEALELIYLGQQILPHGFQFAGTTVGGLSGIDYDATTGRYWVISDDRSESGPSRFYELSLDLGQFARTPNPGHAGITMHAMQSLKRLDGSAFSNVQISPSLSADPESIRVHGPSGRLIWSSEGERSLRPGTPPVLVNPHVWEMQRDGILLRPFVMPAKFHAAAGNRGIRRNHGFEGLAFSPDFATLYAMTENALLQDGPASSITESSPSRLLALDYASGQPRAEYVVDVAPIPFAPSEPGGFADNGVSEILALDAQRLLLLERSFAAGAGVTLRLFIIDLRGATDVSPLDALAGQRYTPVAKRLLFDFKTLGIPLDNIEGMTWGPLLSGGQRSLIFVSDDNFNNRQFTQFLAFETRER